MEDEPVEEEEEKHDLDEIDGVRIYGGGIRGLQNLRTHRDEPIIETGLSGTRFKDRPESRSIKKKSRIIIG